MRFFSNDAKETTENDPDRTQDDTRAQDAQGVPQQRAGSPWSDAPATSDTETDTDGHDHTAERTGDHDDLDLPLDERDDKPYEQANVNESTVTSPDAPVDEPADAEVRGSDEDPALRDEGGFDSPEAVDPDTDKPLDSATETSATDTSTTDATDVSAVDSDLDADRSDLDRSETDVEPVQATAVDQDEDTTTYASASAASADASAESDDTLAEDPTPADTSDTAPVVAAVPVPAAAATPELSEPVAAKPGSVEEKKVDTLFGADDAKALQERWRDVQLRFVDSPKDATAEAAGLVDEAVDKLTASLKSQKDGLLSDSDDTEKLRVELRGYRDILNKVLAL